MIPRADVAPVVGVSRDYMDKLDLLIEKLPSDAKELAVLAVGSGETENRLACCVKLLKMLRKMCPSDNLQAAGDISADKHNQRFELELTTSTRFPDDSLTTVFTCLVASIGTGPLRRYLQSPSSVNPFVQCMRVAFRLIWRLRCRYLVIRGLREQNMLAVVNNAMRLCSYPDFHDMPQRATLHSALTVPTKLSLTRLAHLVPEMALLDVAKTDYDEFKKLLDDNAAGRLEELEHEVDGLLKSKQTLVYFSARIDLEDSLVVRLLHPGPFRDDPLKEMIKYFLYELCPDPDREKFTREFANAVTRAAGIEFSSKLKRFELVSHVDFDEPPESERMKGKEEPSSPERSKRKQGNGNSRRPPGKFQIASIFRPPRDFVADTKSIRI